MVKVPRSDPRILVKRMVGTCMPQCAVRQTWGRVPRPRGASGAPSQRARAIGQNHRRPAGQAGGVAGPDRRVCRRVRIRKSTGSMFRS